MGAILIAAPRPLGFVGSGNMFRADARKFKNISRLMAVKLATPEQGVIRKKRIVSSVKIGVLTMMIAWV